MDGITQGSQVAGSLIFETTQYTSRSKFQETSAAVHKPCRLDLR